MMVARGYKNDAAKVARHLRWPVGKVQAAFNYAEAFPSEINEALADNDAMDFASLSRLLPQAEEFILNDRNKD
jgi:hypothetical protein